jgi:hypothetical protein
MGSKSKIHVTIYRTEIASGMSMDLSDFERKMRKNFKAWQH